MENYNSLQFQEIKDIISKYCAFSLGKNLILDSYPSFHKLTIQRDLKRCQETCDLVIRYGAFPFGGISDITSLLNSSLIDAKLTGLELREVANHAYGCDNIKNFLKKSEFKTEELEDLVSSLNYSLNLSNEIERCINYQGEVNDNASIKLKNLRKELSILETNIQKECHSFINNHKNLISEDIITQRSDRYVILVKTSDKNSIGGFIHGESNSGQTTYIEPESLFSLNNQRQTLISNIEDEINRILLELTKKVKEEAFNYLYNLKTLALLDSLNAKALWCKDNHGCVASINDYLLLKNARHPLIDPKKVVANTYSLKNNKKVLLISGPNTGGKTVSLKIVGLFALMTQTGFPILCDEAFIPLFDNIFVDIGDEQSITNDLSTFSGHISKISYICDNVTSNSLVILDEPGDGTDPKEGECLAIAILDYLRKVGCLSLVTTHFSKLKTYANKYDDILLSSVEFDEESLVPTYRFIEGISGQSNALEIAKRLNLKDGIINRAKELKISSRTKEESLIENLELSLAHLRKKEEEIELNNQDVLRLKEELNNKVSSYNLNKEKLIEEAKNEAEAYLNSKIEFVDNLIKEMLNKDKVHEVISLKKELENTIDSSYENNNNHIFELNDYVVVKGTNQRGNIIELNNQKVTIDVNGLKIKTTINDINYLANKPIVKKEKSYISVSRPSSISLELNLIGKHVDEALIDLDQYIDKAILLKTPFVRIVHGFGSGVLRKAIWEHLKDNRNISNLRYDDQNSGATIVTFKK